MELFEALGIAPGLAPDAAEVRRQWLRESRKWHPDYFTESGPEEIAEAERKSAVINKAREVLTNRTRLLQYLLQTQEPNEGEATALSPNFLMEMMELNEERESGENEAAVNQRVQQLEDALDAEVAPLFETYAAGLPPAEMWTVLRGYLEKKKYLARLKGQNQEI